MPDISKCNNQTCVKREQCYRFTCEPSEFRQSYLDFEPTKNNKYVFHCSAFIQNVPKYNKK